MRILGLGVGSSEASLIVEELAEFIVALKFSKVVVLSAYEFHGFGFWCRGMDRTSTRPAFPSWVFYGFQPERGTAQASGSPTVINLA